MQERLQSVEKRGRARLPFTPNLRSMQRRRLPTIPTTSEDIRKDGATYVQIEEKTCDENKEHVYEDMK